MNCFLFLLLTSLSCFGRRIDYPSNAYDSIREAIADADFGDEVVLAAGTHRVNGQFQLNLRQSGVTVRGESSSPRDQIVVRGQVKLSGENISLSHFTLDCEFQQGDCIQGSGSFALIHDLEVGNSNGDCIDALGSVDNPVMGWVISHCRIHHCLTSVENTNFVPAVPSYAHGFTCNNVADLLISDSEFFLIAGNALSICASTPAAWRNVTVTRTLIHSGVLDQDVFSFKNGTQIGFGGVETSAAPESWADIHISNVTISGYRQLGSSMNVIAAMTLRTDVRAVISRIRVHDCFYGFRLRGAVSGASTGALIRMSNLLVYDVSGVVLRFEDGVRDFSLNHAVFGRNVSRILQDVGVPPGRLDDGSDSWFNIAILEADSIGTVRSPGQAGAIVIASVADFRDPQNDDYFPVTRVLVGNGVRRNDTNVDIDGYPLIDPIDVGCYEFERAEGSSTSATSSSITPNSRGAVLIDLPPESNALDAPIETASSSLGSPFTWLSSSSVLHSTADAALNQSGADSGLSLNLPLVFSLLTLFVILLIVFVLFRRRRRRRTLSAPPLTLTKSPSKNKSVGRSRSASASRSNRSRRGSVSTKKSMALGAISSEYGSTSQIMKPDNSSSSSSSSHVYLAVKSKSKSSSNVNDVYYGGFPSSNSQSNDATPSSNYGGVSKSNYAAPPKKVIDDAYSGISRDTDTNYGGVEDLNPSSYAKLNVDLGEEVSYGILPNQSVGGSNYDTNEASLDDAPTDYLSLNEAMK